MIFELASATERSALPATTERTGLTLAALQDIGREVGISPEAITVAARSLDVAGRPSTRKFLGLPVGVGRTVALDRQLPEPEWEALVSDMRATFDTRGKVSIDGSFRQWSNGNLQAVAEATPGGHRVRLRTVNGNALALMTGGMAGVGVAAATSLAVALGSGFSSSAVTGIAFLVATGVGMFVAGAMRLPGWARLRRDQLDEVANRLISNTVNRQAE